MGRPISILVIDDDALSRNTILAILEGEGYSVTCAVDGRHGLAAFRKSRPDLWTECLSLRGSVSQAYGKPLWEPF
jgi:CheY-like chemotaxis protein